MTVTSQGSPYWNSLSKAPAREQMSLATPLRPWAVEADSGLGTV